MEKKAVEKKGVEKEVEVVVVVAVVVVVVVMLFSSTSSSLSLEADVVPTAKADFARKISSRETRSVPRTWPPTQGHPTRWP